MMKNLLFTCVNSNKTNVFGIMHKLNLFKFKNLLKSHETKTNKNDLSYIVMLL